MVESTLWYTFSLWVGTAADIAKLESCILRFIWTQNDSTRYKVDFASIILPTLKGGLGLVSISQQVKALLAKMIIWAISDGHHQLKTIIQGKIMDMSERKYGIRDYSSVFFPCRSMQSPALQNVFTAWNAINLLHQEAYSIEDWPSTPLW